MSVTISDGNLCTGLFPTYRFLGIMSVPIQHDRGTGFEQRYRTHFSHTIVCHLMDFFSVLIPKQYVCFAFLIRTPPSKIPTIDNMLPTYTSKEFNTVICLRTYFNLLSNLSTYI